MLSTEGQIGLADIIEDADKRGMLTRIELPVLSAELAGDALSQIDTQPKATLTWLGHCSRMPIRPMAVNPRWAAFGSG